MWKIWLLWIHPPLIVILAWEDHMGKQQSVHRNKVLTWVITNGQRNKGEIWNLAFIFIFLIIFFTQIGHLLSWKSCLFVVFICPLSPDTQHTMCAEVLMTACPQAGDAMHLGFDFSECTGNISSMTNVHKCVSRNLKRAVWEVCDSDFKFIRQVSFCEWMLHHLSQNQ